MKTQTWNQLSINGKPMPFTAEELKKVLAIIQKSLLEVEEQVLNEGEEKIMGDLTTELDKI